MRNGSIIIMRVLRCQLGNFLGTIVEHFVGGAGTLVSLTTESWQRVSIHFVSFTKLLCIREAIFFEGIDVKATLIHFCAIPAFLLSGIHRIFIKTTIGSETAHV